MSDEELSRLSIEKDIKISEILYSTSPEFLIKFCTASSLCLSVIDILFAIVYEIILFQSNCPLI